MPGDRDWLDDPMAWPYARLHSTQQSVLPQAVRREDPLPRPMQPDQNEEGWLAPSLLVGGLSGAYRCGWPLSPPPPWLSGCPPPPRLSPPPPRFSGWPPPPLPRGCS